MCLFDSKIVHAGQPWQWPHSNFESFSYHFRINQNGRTKTIWKNATFFKIINFGFVRKDQRLWRCTSTIKECKAMIHSIKNNKRKQQRNKKSKKQTRIRSWCIQAISRRYISCAAYMVAICPKYLLARLWISQIMDNVCQTIGIVRITSSKMCGFAMSNVRLWIVICGFEILRT